MQELDARGNRIQLLHSFGDAITAGHKLLNAENESRLDHCFAVVAQDIVLTGFHSALRRIKLRLER